MSIFGRSDEASDMARWCVEGDGDARRGEAGRDGLYGLSILPDSGALRRGAVMPVLIPAMELCRGTLGGPVSISNMLLTAGAGLAVRIGGGAAEPRRYSAGLPSRRFRTSCISSFAAERRDMIADRLVLLAR